MPPPLLWLAVSMLFAGLLWLATGGSGLLPGNTPSAPVYTLDGGDLAYAAVAAPPAKGWTAGARLGLDVRRQALAHGVDPPGVWVRYRFDSAIAAGKPLAMACDFMRERFTVFYNGVDIARTNGGPGDPGLAWHRPKYVPLPARLLRSGSNEIIFHIESTANRPLSIGTVSIGGDAAVRTRFNRQMFFNTSGPEVINGILATLSLASLLAWFARPRERVFGWLTLVGGVWYFRNLHYFVDTPPFDSTLFWTLTTDSIFALMAVVYGFAATFFDLPGKRRLMAMVTLVCVAGVLVRHALVAAGQSDVPSFLLTIPVAVATLIVLARAVWRQPKTENLFMLAAVAAATAFAFHDLLLVSQGTGVVSVYLQPLGSLLVFSAFGFALGRRMLVALATNEDVNMTLERRMAEATASLERSEAQRRELQVASAVENERERMMREIHDGIGSNLITALAVAEQQRESPGTIATLRRSITDLRIGVDSLEPVGGDVVTLLANLRHRMEHELRALGVAFVWKVQPSPVLPWLDPVGALHLLRILQETISNILMHAGARLVDVACAPESRDGAPGVVIVIADDGHGFDPGTTICGRGLSNMKARAEALNARFACDSSVGAGTRVSIWLPLVQRSVAGAPA